VALSFSTAPLTSGSGSGGTRQGNKNTGGTTWHPQQRNYLRNQLVQAA
jgi:hypothetical protein